MREEKDKAAIAEAAILKRMEEGPFPFKFHDLYRVGNLAVGDERMMSGGFAYRIADRLIQRERKAGRIVQTKRGQWVRP